MKITLCHQSLVDGSASDELDVLEQVEFVEASLRRLSVTTSVLPVSLNLQAAATELLAQKPELIFNLVESLNDRGELIAAFPALLDSLGLTYTGSSADALYVSSNKLLARQQMQLLGLPIAAEPHVGRAGPYLVKSVWEHASRGLDQDSVVELERVQTEILAREARFGGKFFAEAYLHGREFNVGLLQGPKDVHVLPIAEMMFSGYGDEMRHIVDYAAKWQPESRQYADTQRRFLGTDDTQLVSGLERIARSCWRGFGLGGYARVDFRVVANEVFVIDVNANPCLSPDAGFCAALAEAEIPFDRAIEWILNAALTRRCSTREANRPC
jgi:D-alanine-D-alanine ligase